MSNWRLIETGNYLKNGAHEYILERNQKCVKIASYSDCQDVLMSRMKSGDTYIEDGMQRAVSYEYIRLTHKMAEAYDNGDELEYQQLREMVL